MGITVSVLKKIPKYSALSKIQQGEKRKFNLNSIVKPIIFFSPILIVYEKFYRMISMNFLFKSFLYPYIGTWSITYNRGRNTFPLKNFYIWQKRVSC